jgi:ATP-binding cassette subfamily C (CFTR/MRP) protein 1
MSFADTIVALNDGRIAQIGSPQALLAYEGSVAKLGIALGDEGLIREHVEDTEISRIESTVAESFHLVPYVTDEANITRDATRKNGDWSVYSYYFSSSGYTIIIVFLVSMAIWIFCTEFASKCTKSRLHP